MTTRMAIATLALAGVTGLTISGCGEETVYEAIERCDAEADRLTEEVLRSTDEHETAEEEGVIRDRFSAQCMDAWTAERDAE